MKICQTCEKTSNYDRFISNDENTGLKCDTFLDLDHFVFGKMKKTNDTNKINRPNQVKKNNEKLFEKYEI